MNAEIGRPFAAGAGVDGVETGIGARDGYEPPTYEVICLACEISAYAPDGDTPLF